MSRKDHILQSTLEQLEQKYWGEAVYNSYLVKRTHALRKIPLNQFTVEDLRIMIGQKFSLDYLVPLALDVLGQDPVAEGGYYPGDPMGNVLKVDLEFWQNNRDLRVKLGQLIEQSKDALDENGIDYSPYCNPIDKL